MGNPKVSVIMAAYNSGKYIEESILSILNQTLKDLELIIVDDCSTDEVPKIIEKYRQLDERIITIRNNINSGIAVSRNNGINRAKADYIAVMDSDDLAFPDKLQVQYDFLKHEPNVGAVASGTQIIDENGIFMKNRIGLTDPDEIKFRLLLKNPFINSSVLFRKKLFEEMGGYSKEFEYSEDYSFFSFLSEKYKLASIPEILTKYRQNSQSSVTFKSNSRKTQIENSLKINIRNVNRYIKLSPEKVNNLVNTINKWPISFTELIKSLIIYKKLVRQYTKKRELNQDQIQKVLKIYKSDKQTAVGAFLKVKWPRICSLAKCLKPHT